ncbi:MAG TPA: hypothetical protein VHT26_07630 [Trebonia sp.]|nr:hypothetical protein [Trebonia sp.]
MLLERFILKVFAPRRLARRDIRKVFQAVELANRHIERGSKIAYEWRIPERDLAHLLLLMERNGYIERDSGPFDAPYNPDPLRSWWCPGKHYLEGIDQLAGLR